MTMPIWAMLTLLQLMGLCNSHSIFQKWLSLLFEGIQMINQSGKYEKSMIAHNE